MWLGGCSADSQENAKGVCQTESGSVNTHNLLGKWKKISSNAETPTTEEEREFNYELLVVEPGAAICLGKVVNKALAGAVFKGAYTHDVASKIYNVTYSAHIESSFEDTSEDVRYSFSGSCSDTKLNLVYPKDGTVEQYELFSTKVEQGDCN